MPEHLQTELDQARAFLEGTRAVLEEDGFLGAARKIFDATSAMTGANLEASCGFHITHPNMINLAE